MNLIDTRVSLRWASGDPGYKAVSVGTEYVRMTGRDPDDGLVHDRAIVAVTGEIGAVFEAAIALPATRPTRLRGRWARIFPDGTTDETAYQDYAIPAGGSSTLYLRFVDEHLWLEAGTGLAFEMRRFDGANVSVAKRVLKFSDPAALAMKRLREELA